MRGVDDVSGPPDDARLAALAAEHHGVVAYRELLGLGYTRRMVRTRVERGRLHRLFPEVYAVGHTRLTLHGRWMAAVLACGPGALLSHRAAARLHGLLRGTGSGAIDVRAQTRRQLRGIRSHTTRRPGRRDATIVDGIPATSWARTVLDLAAIVPRPRLRDALELAERQGRDFAQLHALVDRSLGHHGLRQLAVALGELSDAAPEVRSDADADLLALVRGAGLPEPQLNVVIAGEIVDFYWPEPRLVVEVDSRRWHGLQRDLGSDRRRDIRLAVAGYLTIRLTAGQIASEPRQVIADLSALLERRAS